MLSAAKRDQHVKRRFPCTADRNKENIQEKKNSCKQRSVLSPRLLYIAELKAIKSLPRWYGDGMVKINDSC